MSGHTKGPWRAEQPHARIKTWRITAGAAHGECDVVAEKVYSAGDAHLIAAAPDMLEALEAVGVALGGLDDVGTSEAIVCNEHTAPVINAALAKVRAAIAKAKKVGV